MTTERMQLDTATPAGPVTCLGQTFASDTARREHYSALLREKLKDPAFRAIEGFPHGADDDIIALSDPPYYTACPNPWLADFVAEWEAAKPAAQRDAVYSREPFAADVSEGKNDPIYNAHSYHTKVPHKAIMRYILHYTQPGDIVFDGFCGTGMTGVAAQMCGDREVVSSLGYKVNVDGTIFQEEIEVDGKTVWKPFSKLGVRRAVLNDLSPAASFIAYNYNTPVDSFLFDKEANQILKLVEKECGWMYHTKHSDGRTGKINYTVWSDVFLCAQCTGELIFWNEAVDAKNGKVLDEFPCPHCGASQSKHNMQRAWITIFDPELNESIAQAKQVPVQINYSVQGISGRIEKTPDQFDLHLIHKINDEPIPYWIPSNKVPAGDKTSDPFRVGVTHAHHFYTKRNLRVLATLRHYLKSSPIEGQLLCLVGDQLPRASKMHKIAVSRLNTNLSKTAGVLAGTLYIPSNQIEYNINLMIGFRIKDVISYQAIRDKITRQVVFTGSSESTQIPSESMDYLFFDPPFGSNLMYSELNFLWETWLGVVTNKTPEAIENSSQKKNLDVYRKIMTTCLKEAYRALRPGRWITVEFSNTKASVWNSIQTSITEAGFIVANVSALDKKQGTFNAVTNTTSVKQDLVITAYKPSDDFEQRFQKEAHTEQGVWDFVRTHLRYLPVTKRQGTSLISVTERDPRILFDQVIAYYIRKGFPVPIDSAAFQQGLAQRFVERDGMFFLADQVVEYDRAVAQGSQLVQTSLFVSDESSAIQWLRQVLKRKPHTFADINPEFMQQLGGWSKNETELDLRVLLEQNFLSYAGDDAVPDQIHAYLSSNYPDLRNKADTDPALRAKAKDRWYVPDPNKAQDLEQVRERALLREYDGYVAQTGKLKVFRLEAIRAGFKRAYQQQHYKNIVAMAKRLPTAVIEEDEKLLMWVDNATMRIGE